MTLWPQPLERQLIRWENWFGALGIAILVAVGVLICIDVGLRYIFNYPIVGGIEIIEHALVYITFLGASWAVPRGAHIDIDVAVQAMPSFWQKVCALLSNLISLGVACVLTVFGTVTTWTAFSRAAFKPTTLEIPTWIVLIIIPIGCALLALRFLRESIMCIEALATGEVAGDIGVHHAEPLHGVFSYGISILSEHRGKGFASDAIILLLRYCFLELRMHKANAGVWAYNEASLAMHRKLGFVEEGRLRDNIFSNGAHHDEYRFGMTDAEFFARYGRGEITKMSATE